MMKEVLISIRPEWCERIANGEKTVEVRKTKPKLETPFKCYIYCTKSELLTKSHYNGKIYVATSKKYQKLLERNGNITLSGKVIGEFVCDNIFPVSYTMDGFADAVDCKTSCLSQEDLYEYGNGKTLYGWHISDLKIYDKPKELSEFGLSRPPQNWCYVESIVYCKDCKHLMFSDCYAECGKAYKGIVSIDDFCDRGELR